MARAALMARAFSWPDTTVHRVAPLEPKGLNIRAAHDRNPSTSVRFVRRMTATPQHPSGLGGRRGGVGTAAVCHPGALGYDDVLRVLGGDEAGLEHPEAGEHGATQIGGPGQHGQPSGTARRATTTATPAIVSARAERMKRPGPPLLVRLREHAEPMLQRVRSLTSSIAAPGDRHPASRPGLRDRRGDHREATRRRGHRCPRTERASGRRPRARRESRYCRSVPRYR